MQLPTDGTTNGVLKMHAKSYNQQLQDIVDPFVKSGGCEPIDSDEHAAFAIKKRLWMTK